MQTPSFLLAVFIVTLCASSLPAAARMVCQDTIGRQGSYGGIHNMNQQCVYEAGPDKPSAQVQLSFGAIAYSPSHAAAGWSDSAGSRAAAEKDAMGGCVKNAAPSKDCEIAVWFENRCAAVTADKNPTEYWAIGASLEQAKASAVQKCTADKRSNCKVYVSHCSLR